MSSVTGSGSRTRKQRALHFGDNQTKSWFREHFNKSYIYTAIFYCFFIGIICVINEAWYPALFYQMNYVPQRSMVSRIQFTAIDKEGTELAKIKARQATHRVFIQDNRSFDMLIPKLQQDLNKIDLAKDYTNVPPDIWSKFMPLDQEVSVVQMRQCFRALQAIDKEEQAKLAFYSKFKAVLEPYYTTGVLFKSETDEKLGEIHSDDIKIVSKSDGLVHWAPLNNVVISDWDRVRQNVNDVFGDSDVADMIFWWIRQNLQPTLKLDIAKTIQEMNQAVEKVENLEVTFLPGDTLAEAGKPISARSWSFIELEYKYVQQLKPMYLRIVRFVATWISLCLLFYPSLCIASRVRLRFFENVRQTVILSILALLVVCASKYLSDLGCNAQTLVLFMFVITLTIAFGRRVTFLIIPSLITVSVLGSGGGVCEFIYQAGVVTSAVLPLDRIQNRKKIILLSLSSACVAFVLAITCNVLNFQPLGLDQLTYAGFSAIWVIVAGFLMHGLVPLEERLFGIVTDSQLLELSDVAHPLMQELIQRAPSTYNHSMLVAAIAESAARSIGAWGLLCRIGAYYHDIGKFVTPDYFVENQKTLADSQHTNLAPSMSALVIINHVKDGVALAQKYKLPQQIIDFIEQHHGTTLVKYFYNKAIGEQKQKLEEENPGAVGNMARAVEQVDESQFRYPGPKPQTKEAAIIMLADCVESACRTLVEPTPKRVEEMVNNIAADKLKDGQFDETGLTFNELRTIQESMILSILSIYHARIKYPEEAK